AVDDIDFNIDNWITAEYAIQHSFVDAFFNCGNVFARNNAADDLVFDDQPAASRGGTHIYFDVAVLTATTGLFDQLANAVRTRGNSLAIRDLRFARVCVYLELAEHPVANDLQVQLAHPGDNRLTGVFVRVNA